MDTHAGRAAVVTGAARGTGQAIKRIATADDVVGTVCFLSSEDSAFMTGQTLVPDGGLMRV